MTIRCSLCNTPMLKDLFGSDICDVCEKNILEFTQPPQEQIIEIDEDGKVHGDIWGIKREP